MEHNTKEDIMRLAQEEDVEFIRLQFTDIFGMLKNIAITASQLEKALANRCMFDGSSIDGFARIEESDMYLYPDLDTVAIFPWRPQQGKVARLLCDIYLPDGRPYEGDPRYILKKVLGKAQAQGYTLEVGPECEFFLFETDDNAQPTTITNEQAGYFDVGPLDFGENARRDMVLTLEEMGFVVDGTHHENAPAQHEIDLHYDEALRTADNIITMKLAVRTIAKQHGLHATFMPKPKYGVNGSGMHLNLSMKKDGKNIFADGKDANGLSQEAYWFIGGLMKHARAITAIANPLVNSYKRLVAGYEAPIHVAWSAKNRSPLIRIPAVADPDNARIELRSPDSSANPYLVIAACMIAGMDGIENHIQPPARTDGNIYEMSNAERQARGIQDLPVTLAEAIEALEHDEILCSGLGEEFVRKYAEIKRSEWNAYRSQISQWELQEYLNKY